ncbi:uncharacterized protein PAC_16580 [Phialocephala subalpina]|uniref:Uncharacterized protein n=1 Tax=Phialocephala subalpina TaxID=576137 RepID=A0A1L7XNS2_9HELO|nr:uncharacterized protein PAC_16580 [Phialocephala subalpina]
MVMDRVLRFFGRDPKRHKGVPGSQLNIELFKPPYTDASQPWPREAAYIPTNNRHYLSRTLAEEMGLDIDDESTAEVRWRVKRTLGATSYTCLSKFTIRQDLPCDVIFGNFDGLGMFRGYPNPFEAATKHNFKTSFDLSKSRPPRTNSWAKFTQRKLSWASFDRTKDNSRRSSFLTKSSPSIPTTNVFPTNIPPSNVDLEPRAIPKSDNEVDKKPGSGIYRPEDTVPVEGTASLKLQLSSVSEEPRTPLPDTESPNRNESKELVRDQQLPAASPLPLDYDFKALQKLEYNWKVGVRPDLAPVASDTLRDEIKGFHVTSQPQPQRQGDPILVRLLPIDEVKNGLSAFSRPGLDAALQQSKDLKSKLTPESKADMKNSKMEELLSSLDPSVVEPDISNASKFVLESSVNDDESIMPGIMKISGTDSQSPDIPEGSISAQKIGGNLAPQISAAADMPKNHGKITSYGVEKFLEQGTENTQVHSHRTGTNMPDGSDQSSIHQPTRPRRVKNSRDVPRIRRVMRKEPAAQTVESATMPRSDGYWTWDSAVNGYYHIDSDTGSRHWYEDSESEESQESEDRGRSQAGIPGPREIPPLKDD